MRFLFSLVARIGRLPRPVLFGAAVVLLAGGAVAVVVAYRTWDYIEHDNEFCLSCHVMQDPFERFAESEHRGLGCKACHKPTFVGRSRMALTQILENPEEIEEHAEVPNEKCVSCHVDGDPEQWTLISRSVGHRVHLESEDTSLSGLRCVECHSSGVHEFAATSQTCAQAGCHENVEIKLGRMGDFTIHCVACHDFSRPADEPALVATGGADVRASSVVAPLRPEAAECLSCHAMRLLVGEIPEDEPHGAVCGACHNPHEQTTPAQAVQSCAASECHASADTITPMHRGLPAGTLERCTLCHAPHDAPIGEVRCVACHADGARIDRGETLLPHGVGQEIRSVTATGTPLPVADETGQPFDHQRHGAVECTACHVSADAHGEIRASSLRECRECHHTPSAVGVPCTRCHQEQRTGREVHHVARTMDLTTGRRVRGLPLVHAQHGSVECTRCHTQGVELSAASVDCASCHTQHHRPQAVCRSCHLEAPEGTHELAVHTGCAGSGCHSALPFQNRPDTREFCLACHQDLVRHEPGRECTACHALPEWRRTVSR
ncbi:MAG TPA: NapC/NirT family cytochrome c [Longimicrobiales bacterium]|nr:NapC/NirT family cytochrome c [Longimicrobiales bacterium]